MLHIIQDKLNNPSPDDPFEPEIAGVSVQLVDSLVAEDNPDLASASS